MKSHKTHSMKSHWFVWSCSNKAKKVCKVFRNLFADLYNYYPLYHLTAQLESSGRQFISTTYIERPATIIRFDKNKCVATSNQMYYSDVWPPMILPKSVSSLLVCYRNIIFEFRTDFCDRFESRSILWYDLRIGFMIDTITVYNNIVVIIILL